MSSESETPLYSVVKDKISEWHYRDLYRNTHGGFNSYVKSSENSQQPPRFQMCSLDEPKCNLPFGVSDKFAKAGSSRRTLDFGLHSPDQIAFWEAVDEHTIQVAIAKKDEWWPGKDLDEATIRSYYRPCLTTQDNYAPNLRSKIDTAEGGINVMVARPIDGSDDLDFQVGSAADLEQKAEVIPIMEYLNIWFMSKQFGATIQTTDIIVFPPTRKSGFNLGGLNVKRKAPEPVVESDTIAVKLDTTEPIEPEEAAGTGKKKKTRRS